jgi:hypothetical protein
VNKNVTTPEGAAAAGAGTPAQCHNRYAATLHIAGIGAVTGYASYETDFRESQMWSFSRPGTRCDSINEDMLHGEDDREVVTVNIFPRGRDHQLEILVMLPVSLRRNVLPLSRFQRELDVSSISCISD